METISKIINMINYDGNSIPWQGRMLFNMRNTSTISTMCDNKGYTRKIR